jgi:hypothetical protein
VLRVGAGLENALDVENARFFIAKLKRVLWTWIVFARLIRVASSLWALLAK